MRCPNCVRFLSPLTLGPGSGARRFTLSPMLKLGTNRYALRRRTSEPRPSGSGAMSLRHSRAPLAEKSRRGRAGCTTSLRFLTGAVRIMLGHEAAVGSRIGSSFQVPHAESPTALKIDPRHECARCLLPFSRTVGRRGRGMRAGLRTQDSGLRTGAHHGLR